MNSFLRVTSLAVILGVPIGILASPGPVEPVRDTSTPAPVMVEALQAETRRLTAELAAARRTIDALSLEIRGLRSEIRATRRGSSPGKDMYR